MSPVPNPGMQNKVQWFKKNLELQLEDIELTKQGVKVETYFDTADVRRAVLGMQAFYHSGSRFDEDMFRNARTLVRCLATSGWLGKIQMLPSHQAEFLSLMNMNFGLGRDKAPFDYTNRFIRDVKNQLWSDSHPQVPLEKVVGEMSEEELIEFVKQVKQHAESAEIYFKAFECIGLWQPRLARWLSEKSLYLEPEKYRFAPILGKREFTQLKQAFDERRASFDNMNNFADAVAVTILIESVRTYADGRATTLPRFFVPTNLFHEIVEDAGVIPLLSYRGGDRGADGQRYDVVHDPASVLRGADYFIFRSTFRPATKKDAAPKAQALNFAGIELSELYEVVNDILATQRPLTDKTIKSIEVSGIPLNEIIDGVQQFSFLKNVWLRFIEASDIRRVQQLEREARDLVKYEEVQKAIRVTKEALRENASEYRQVRSIWGDLKQSSLTLRARVSGGAAMKPFDAFRDLGLLRFGFPSGAHKQLQEIINAILFGGEEEQRAARNSVIAALYAETSSPHEEVNELVLGSAMLWLTKMDANIIMFLDGASADGPLPHFSLRLIYAAAAIRSKKSLRKAREVLAELEKEHKAISPRSHQQRADLAVGIAYLFYRLWWALGYRPAWFPPADFTKPADADGKRLVKRAVEYSKQAYDVLLKTQDKTKRVYALNLYLFYMIMGGGEDYNDDIDLTAATLSLYKPDSDLWQYRFDDTLAHFFHRLATSARTPEEWEDMMQNAKVHLEEARREAHGDEDVEDYWTIFSIDRRLGFRRRQRQA